MPGERGGGSGVDASGHPVHLKRDRLGGSWHDHLKDAGGGDDEGEQMGAETGKSHRSEVKIRDRTHDGKKRHGTSL
jgi:hypothetical protein